DLLDDGDHGAAPTPVRTDHTARAPSLQDRPSAAELVDAVREFLERDVQRAVDGRVAFHTRVAVNALGMVERELALGPGLDAEAPKRLAGFLGQDGGIDTLVAELANRIRAGSLDDDPEALAVTRDLVRAKLEVANPRYLTASAP